MVACVRALELSLSAKSGFKIIWVGLKCAVCRCGAQRMLMLISNYCMSLPPHTLIIYTVPPCLGREKKWNSTWPRWICGKDSSLSSKGKTSPETQKHVNPCTASVWGEGSMGSHWISRHQWQQWRQSAHTALTYWASEDWAGREHRSVS